MGRIRDEELADVSYVMSDARGRRFVYRLLSVYGLYQSTLVRTDLSKHIPDKLLPTYNGARQEVAQAIHNEALACDQTGALYFRMASEAEARRVAKDLEERKQEAEAIRRKKENGDDSGSDGDPDRSGGDPSADGESPGSGT